MKILFFHLMPYGDLPKDFAEHHKSAWIDVDPTLFDAAKAHVMFHEYLDEMQFADELGFDGLCVNEHHSNAYGMMCSPQMMATLLARTTRRAAILIMGSSIALYDPPQRIAEDMATVDILSGGRLIAGFPVGTQFDSCYAMGQNPSSLRQKYYEAHDIIVKAWREREMFAYNGKYYKQPFVSPFLQPAQRPHPPIWVPGGGAVETWRWTAEMDYVYTYTSYFGYRAAQVAIDGFWAVASELGRDRNPFRLGFLQFVGVAESKREAMRLYREPAEYFWNFGLRANPRWSSPPGYVTEATMRAKMASQTQRIATPEPPKQGAQHDSQRMFGGKLSIEELVELGYFLIGSPDEVAAQLREAATNLNSGQLMVMLHFGNMDRDTTFYNTEMFARYVKPQIEGMWEGDWENKWWPKPLLDEHQRSVPRPIAQGPRLNPDRPVAPQGAAT